MRSRWKAPHSGPVSGPHRGSVLILAGLLISLGWLPIAQAQLVAAVLPSSRSAEVGSVVTVFSTVINAGSETATGCGISAPAGLGATFSYQATNPATNEVIGQPDVPVTLEPGASQSFVLSLTPTTVIDSVDAQFSFSCDSGSSATAIPGINTLLLSASNTPVADIVALAATSQNTGVLAHDDSVGAFALATINLGAADTITVMPDTGGVDLPVALSICETNAVTGSCIAEPAAEVSVAVEAGGTPTFSVFSSASGRIASDPAVNRVFVRFNDSNLIVRGGTSVAIDNQPELALSLSDSALSVLERIFSLLFGAGQSPGSGFSISSVSPAVSVPIEQTIPCDDGEIRVTGSVDTDENGSSSTLVMAFDACEGISGSLTVTSDVMLGAETISVSSTQNGVYSTDECEEVRVSDFRVSTSFNTADPLENLVELGEISVSGTISGRCEGQSFSCDLQDADLADEEAFAQSCSI